MTEWLEELRRLLPAAEALRDDMIMRAGMKRKARDGTLIVEAGAGVWHRFCEAIDGVPPIIAQADRVAALEAEVERLREALLATVNATRAYLPPDGIDEQECINRILAATDNPEINPYILATEARAALGGEDAAD